jgi:hypothetical protein
MWYPHELVKGVGLGSVKSETASPSRSLRRIAEDASGSVMRLNT